MWVVSIDPEFTANGRKRVTVDLSIAEWKKVGTTVIQMLEETLEFRLAELDVTPVEEES